MRFISLVNKMMLPNPLDKPVLTLPTPSPADGMIALLASAAATISLSSVIQNVLETEAVLYCTIKICHKRRNICFLVLEGEYEI